MPRAEELELELYEMWGLVIPALPPRSRLYRLEPLGLGTAAVESLTSYIVRLAEAHCVETRPLLFQEILPHLGYAYMATTNRLAAFLDREGRSLNGMRGRAQDMVRVVEQATGYQPLAPLTMLAWADIFSTRRLLRAQRAWCPACYETWRQEGKPLYDPLQWALQVVRLCPMHYCWLEERCSYADCGRLLPWLAPQERRGYCPHCQRWLGRALGPSAVDQSGVDASLWRVEVWMSHVLGQLLAMTPHLSSPPPAWPLWQAVRDHFQQEGRGAVKRIQEVVDTSHSVIWTWQNGHSQPVLETFLLLCWAVKRTPLQLILGGGGNLEVERPSQEDMVIWRAVHPRQRVAVRRPLDKAGLSAALHTILDKAEEPPPSMRAVAQGLGYGQGILSSLFPDLSQAISARYQSYRQEASRQHRASLAEDIRAAMRDLHIEGIYPSANCVADVLDQPGMMLDSASRAVWFDMLHELGYKTE